jgi:hypothetical protein
MVVYQALRRIVGDVKVLAVLDGRQYDQYQLDISKSTSDGKSYLTEVLFSTLLYHDYEEERHVDPSSFKRYVERNGLEKAERLVLKERVTWLNGEPRSFKEIAVAYLTVSDHAPKTYFA